MSLSIKAINLQEDTVAYSRVQELNGLSEAERKTAIQNTFQQMQQYATAFPHREGSCALTCVMQNDPGGVRITTAYTGDSGAYVLYLDKKGKAKSCDRLNNSIHVETHGTLRVSRAIGDQNDLAHDKHDPEIDSMIIDAKEFLQAEALFLF